MDRHGEVERKFDIEPSAVLPDLAGVAAVGEAVESQLDATYFDTADARLARHHITLRRRTGGDDAGWHLKLPAGQDERIQVRRPLGRATRETPCSRIRLLDPKDRAGSGAQRQARWCLGTCASRSTSGSRVIEAPDPTNLTRCTRCGSRRAGYEAPWQLSDRCWTGRGPTTCAR